MCFVEMTLVKMNFHVSKLWNKILKAAIFVCKMVMFDYLLLTNFGLEYIGCACIYLCFILLEKSCQFQGMDEMLSYLERLFKLEKNTIFEISEAIFQLAKNFNSCYPLVKNLFQYDSFTLDGPNL